MKKLVCSRVKKEIVNCKQCLVESEASNLVKQTINYTLQKFYSENQTSDLSDFLQFRVLRYFLSKLLKILFLNYYRYSEINKNICNQNILFH